MSTLKASALAGAVPAEPASFWTFTTVQLSASLALIAAAPVLAFPELVPVAMRAPVVLGVSIASMSIACWLLPRSGPIAAVAALFAVSALIAWSRAPNAQQAAILATGRAHDSLQYSGNVSLTGEALQHLAGIALGLLSMSVVNVALARS